MTCASCVHAIESNLLKKAGVIAASVALTTNTGRFEFDPDQLGTRDIIESINDLGFQASIPSNDSSKAEALSHAKTIKQLVGISFNPSRPNSGRIEKIKLSFYFHTSLWCLIRFYEGLKDLHKTF